MWHEDLSLSKLENMYDMSWKSGNLSYFWDSGSAVSQAILGCAWEGVWSPHLEHSLQIQSSKVLYCFDQKVKFLDGLWI